MRRQRYCIGRQRYTHSTLILALGRACGGSSLSQAVGLALLVYPASGCVKTSLDELVPDTRTFLRVRWVSSITYNTFDCHGVDNIYIHLLFLFLHASLAKMPIRDDLACPPRRYGEFTVSPPNHPGAETELSSSAAKRLNIKLVAYLASNVLFSLQTSLDFDLTNGLRLSFVTLGSRFLCAILASAHILPL